MEKIPEVKDLSFDEIWEILPPIRKNQLVKTGLKEAYLMACTTKKITTVSHDPDYLKKMYMSDYSNFAAFIHGTFMWVLSPQGYSWWHKAVFNDQFVFEAQGLTSIEVLEKIKSFPSDEEFYPL